MSGSVSRRKARLAPTCATSGRTPLTACVSFQGTFLARFEVPAAAVLDGSASRLAGYLAMVRFWLDEYLPGLRERAGALVGIADLHPSLAAMRAAFTARYARIERVR
jgi:hypothetical protein